MLLCGACGPKTTVPSCGVDGGFVSYGGVAGLARGNAYLTLDQMQFKTDGGVSSPSQLVSVGLHHQSEKPKKTICPCPEDQISLWGPQMAKDRITASFLCCSSTGTRIFSKPGKVTWALNASTLGKYILRGPYPHPVQWIFLGYCGLETIYPKIPLLLWTLFTLGDWTVTCWQAERDGTPALLVRT